MNIHHSTPDRLSRINSQVDVLSFLEDIQGGAKVDRFHRNSVRSHFIDKFAENETILHSRGEIIRGEGEFRFHMGVIPEGSRDVVSNEADLGFLDSVERFHKK